ncbi:ankyrin repeat domain-containing protein [Aspergillus vadensis CBS 113365]|uniref:Ankyrin n=1 Tax=Aspergillus vadensis (strain CBS 113365 / IMI 142717 / IBT 24658) TaxID=1448311 RepID=A0A319BJ05_ASPVC|nr:ankyrin [Aspergillus vadensis CBS 113365]PYH73166.1 ankyrin [Aspergillus vadensis CBS 113365]
MSLPFQVLKEANQPFLKSCRYGDLAQVKKHQEAKALDREVLTMGLREAAQGDHIDTMRHLLNAGAKPQSPSVVDGVHSAEAVKALLDHGLTFETRLHPLNTVPLVHIVKKNDQQLVHWCLEQGADPTFGCPNAQSFNDLEKPDRSPTKGSGAVLGMASRRSSPVIVDLILEHGANIRTSNVLHYAACRKDGRAIPIMEHLLQRGANVNEFGYPAFLHFGGTPLHAGSYQGNLPAVNWLLEHGANPGVEDAQGSKPLDLAALEEEDEICDILYRWSRLGHTGKADCGSSD